MTMHNPMTLEDARECLEHIIPEKFRFHLTSQSEVSRGENVITKFHVHVYSDDGEYVFFSVGIDLPHCVRAAESWAKSQEVTK